MTDQRTVQTDIEAIVPEDKSIFAAGFTIRGRDVVPEQFCTYKVLETQRLIGKITERIDLIQIVAQLRAVAAHPEQGGQLELMAYLLPRLMADVPELIVRFAALCLVPNAELEEIFQKGGPGKIAARIKDEERFLLFHTRQDDVLTIVQAFIPYIGWDAILKKILNLAEKVGDTLGLENIGLAGSSAGS